MTYRLIGTVTAEPEALDKDVSRSEKKLAEVQDVPIQAKTKSGMEEGEVEVKSKKKQCVIL